ncbi:MAG: hypothetical protein ACYTEV_01540 [Planctomycetota bacterium]|jgi:hypothetical protein
MTEPSAVRRRVAGRSAGPAVVLLVAVAAGLVGCRATPPHGPDASDAPAEVDRERVAAILEAHRERVGRLERIHVVGTVGVRWPDGEGDWRSEQVSVRLWVDGRLRTAARFLIGFPETDLFWFGSDEERAWLFDLASETSSLCVWRHDAPTPPPCAEAVVPVIGRPLSTADLLFGAIPLPPDAIDRVRVSPDGRTMRLLVAGRQEPLRLTWSIEDGTLERVEVFDVTGMPRAVADHSEPAPMAVAGLARPLQPRLATRVRVRDRDERFVATFDFDPANSGSIESQRWTTLFDLPTLRRILRPRIVEDASVAGPPVPGR